MFDLIPFKAFHLGILLQQPMNKGLRDTFNPDLAKELESRAMTAIDKETQEVMMCGGVTEYWANRGQVWIVFSEKCKNKGVSYFRAIKRFLQTQPQRRLELSVPVDFEIGHRRAQLLGFSLECALARRYYADGTDCSIYVMIKG